MCDSGVDLPRPGGQLVPVAGEFEADVSESGADGAADRVGIAIADEPEYFTFEAAWDVAAHEDGNPLHRAVTVGFLKDLSGRIGMFLDPATDFEIFRDGRFCEADL